MRVVSWNIQYGIETEQAGRELLSTDELQSLSIETARSTLWFHAGLTYPQAYDRDLDDRIVSSLKQNDVRIVVLETDAMLYSTRRRLRDFPLLRSYLVENFQPAQRFGIFSVLLRKDVAPPAQVGQASDALAGVR